MSAEQLEGDVANAVRAMNQNVQDLTEAVREKHWARAALLCHYIRQDADSLIPTIREVEGQ